MDTKKSLDEIVEEVRIQEEIRKEDEIVQKLNIRIDELEQRFDQQEIDRIIRDSTKANEGYFTTS